MAEFAASGRARTERERYQRRGAAWRRHPGWPDAAPFDAILVADLELASQRFRNLRPTCGGRLIIPIGEIDGTQELVKVVRDGDGRFHEEDLGPVTFVPLIGAGGWGGPGLDAASAHGRLPFGKARRD